MARPRFQDILSGALYEDVDYTPTPDYASPEPRQTGRFSDIVARALAAPEATPAPAPTAEAAPPAAPAAPTLGDMADGESIFDYSADRERTGPEIEEDDAPSELEDAEFFGAMADDLPELAGAPELSELNMPAFATSMGLLTASDDQIADVIQAQYPDAKVRRDDAGNTIVKMPSGVYVANRPGFSIADTTKFIFDVAGFTPAGRLSSWGTGLLADVATDAAMQAATIAASGGEADVDVGQAATNLGFSGALRGVETFVRGLGRDVASDAAEVVQAGKELDFPVVTTDINPPQTRFGLARQAVRESIPVLGTGGARSTQRRAAEAAPDKLLKDFGIVEDLNATDFESAIVRDLIDFNKGQFAKARELRASAIEGLPRNKGLDFSKTFKSVSDIVQRQSALRKMADNTVSRTVMDVAESLFPPGGATTLDQAIAMRSSLIDTLKSVQKKAKGPEPGSAPKVAAALTDLKKAFDKDLRAFIRSEGGESALKKWDGANKIFDTQLKTSRRTALRRVLNEGDVQPELVLNVLRQAKPSDLRRLNENLTQAGRANVRAAILRDAFVKGMDRGEVNPTALTKALDSSKLKQLQEVFFTGAERRALNGFKRLVKLSERAIKSQETTGQMTSGNLATRFVQNLVGGFIGAVESVTPLAAMSKLYESPLVRDALIRIAKLRPESPQTQKALADAAAAIRIATLAGQRQESE